MQQLAYLRKPKSLLVVKILKADTESLLYFEKNIIIGLLESSKNLQQIFKKEGQLLYFAQAVFLHEEHQDTVRRKF